MLKIQPERGRISGGNGEIPGIWLAEILRLVPEQVPASQTNLEGDTEIWLSHEKSPKLKVNASISSCFLMLQTIHNILHQKSLMSEAEIGALSHH